MTQIHMLATIAHYEIALGCESFAPEMKGLAIDFLNSGSPSEKALLNRYVEVRKQTAKNLAEFMEANRESRGEG